MQEVSEFQITIPLCFLLMWPLCLAQFTSYCIEPHGMWRYKWTVSGFEFN